MKDLCKTTQYNRILKIKDSYQAPSRVMELLTCSDKSERDMAFYELAKVNRFDFSRDWFWEYFQEEHADRKNNKQDFTPASISRVVHSILRGIPTEGISVTYEPAAGTGQMIICDWDRQRTQQMPWDYKPSCHIYLCAEYSVKTLPFLLFNLAVRGIVGIVYQMDTLRKQIEAIYKLENPQDSTIYYSDVTKVEIGGDEYDVLFGLI